MSDAAFSDVILPAARFLHYLALTSLFGAAVFPLYAGKAGALRDRTLVLIALAVAISGLLWFCAACAAMTGDPATAVDPATLWTVASHTEFGRVWIVRLTLSLVTILQVGRPRRLAVFSAILLATVAMTGHAIESEGAQRTLHSLADALHLLAAGAWLGGMIPLAAATGRASASEAAAILRRFSGVASVAVAVLVATGLVNAWLLVRTPEALVTTRYGRLLAFKLVLFAAMLALAAVNRFRLTPALAADVADPAGALARLRRNIWAEQALSLGVLLVVAILGAQAPSVAT